MGFRLAVPLRTVTGMSNRPATPAALTAAGFGIFGFVLGLTFTLRGGDGADVAYLATH